MKSSLKLTLSCTELAWVRCWSFASLLFYALRLATERDHGSKAGCLLLESTHVQNGG
jgi:hypothetical protein